jgi:hypothetical protein
MRVPRCFRAWPSAACDDVAGLLTAVGAEDVFVVWVAARPATLVERIIEREPTSWSGLPALVEHAQALARSMPGVAGVDLVLNDGQRPEEVADPIRAAFPPRPAPVGRGGRGLHPPVAARGRDPELLDICAASDRLVAVIRSHVRPEWERKPVPHVELITVRDGKVTEMVVYPTVDEALAAAGLGPGA